jgi:hypothetical protein
MYFSRQETDATTGVVMNCLRQTRQADVDSAATSAAVVDASSMTMPNTTPCLQESSLWDGHDKFATGKLILIIQIRPINAFFVFLCNIY